MYFFKRQSPGHPSLISDFLCSCKRLWLSCLLVSTSQSAGIIGMWAMPSLGPLLFTIRYLMTLLKTSLHTNTSNPFLLILWTCMFICVWAWTCAYRCLGDQKVSAPWSWSSKPHDVGWELNSDPLGEQSTLLTTESFLQATKHIFERNVCKKKSTDIKVWITRLGFFPPK